MLDNALTRRLVTIPLLFLALAIVTLILPLLLVVALLVDLIRSVTSGNRAIAARIVVFVWMYLLGEVWAVISLVVVLILGHSRSTAATYRLQKAWANWNVALLKIVFSLQISTEGDETIAPAPIVVLVRHASLIDSLLPARLIANRYDIGLRYVLKKQLLLDPALDIAGNRLPNYFVDRRSRDAVAEVEAIADLGATMSSSEGIVMFPEGTRFSESKRDRAIARYQGREGTTATAITGYRNVLPPRPGGSLALVNATSADVLVMAHYGLEVFAGVADIWTGRLVGSTVSVGCWRIDRTSIPDEESEQIEWLHLVWADVDTWVTGKAEDRNG